MTDGDRHLVWMRGLRGPVPQVFHTALGATPQMSDGEKRNALSTPRKLGERHGGLSIREIAALHPAPPPKPEDL